MLWGKNKKQNNKTQTNKPVSGIFCKFICMKLFHFSELPLSSIHGQYYFTIVATGWVPAPFYQWENEKDNEGKGMWLHNDILLVFKLSFTLHRILLLLHTQKGFSRKPEFSPTLSGLLCFLLGKLIRLAISNFFFFFLLLKQQKNKYF